MKVLNELNAPGRGVKLTRGDHSLTVMAYVGLDFARTIIEDVLGLNMYWTSALEGTHKVGSKHYTGNAVDVDIVPTPAPHVWTDAVARITSTLPDGYDVVNHGHGTHIHIEWDPK